MATSPQDIIDQIDIALLAFATAGNVQSYTINGRTFVRADVKALWELRQGYASLVSSDAGGATNYATFARD